MRFAAWSDKDIRSVDGRYELRFGHVKEGISVFIIEGLNKTEQEFICLLPDDLCDSIYTMLSTIIPDNATVTRSELITAVKKVSNAVSVLYKRAKVNDFDECL